jgi:hypothetical protein
MKCASLAIGLVVLLTLAANDRAFAQGCDLVPTDSDQEITCNGVVIQDQSCSGRGDPCYYCYEGHGVCSETGQEFYTANVAPDESCGSGCGGGGCCDGTILCNVPRQKCDTDSCACVSSGSPILVDTTGKGFRMTPVEEGVTFDIFANHRPVKMAWTAPDSGNAFLALDRDGNGRIDNGKELFGNITAQPTSDEPNGYMALAEFDKPEKGGNGDGIIDGRDAVYSRLRLWIDANHDGISQPEELHTLPELGVFSIGLRYRDEQYTDRYGNWFRYRAAVNPNPLDGQSRDGRWSYDVFFLVAEGTSSNTGTAGQSSVTRFRHRGVSSFLVGGSYANGVLYDEVGLTLARSKKTRCPLKDGAK